MWAINKKKDKSNPYHLTYTDIGVLAMALVDATIILGSPTVITGPHPQVAFAAYLCNFLRPKVRFAGIIGSYGWGGKMEQDILEMLGNLKAEFLPSIIIKGYPRAEDFQKLDSLAEQIMLNHQKIE